MAKNVTSNEQTEIELKDNGGAPSDAPKGEEQGTSPDSTNQEGQDVAPNKAPAAWGGFKIEVGVATPKSSGTSKYNWAEFPAPKDPNDPTTWPSVFIPDIGGKTIYSSIKTYRDKVQKDGGKAPEFTVSVSKDPKGVRVIRKS